MVLCLKKAKKESKNGKKKDWNQFTKEYCSNEINNVNESTDQQMDQDISTIIIWYTSCTMSHSNESLPYTLWVPYF